jgi:hypothetical protein
MRNERLCEHRRCEPVREFRLTLRQGDYNLDKSTTKDRKAETGRRSFDSNITAAMIYAGMEVYAASDHEAGLDAEILRDIFEAMLRTAPPSLKRDRAEP